MNKATKIILTLLFIDVLFLAGYTAYIEHQKTVITSTQIPPGWELNSDGTFSHEGHVYALPTH